MKAVILARVSTKEQEEQGHSLPAQIRRLQEYAKKKGFEVAETFSFSESAGEKIRKKFDEVMSYLRTHKDTTILLCENVDRATRNFKDAVDLDEMRRKENLEIHFVQDGFFINKNATGNQMFMWEAKVFLAKQYLNRLSDDVKRSNEQKIQNKEWITKAPIGYLGVYDDKGKRENIILDPLRSQYIFKMFEMYATGSFSIKKIQEEMEKMGLKSNTKDPKPIPKSKIHSLLKDPFYYGEMRIKTLLYPHKYQPLISKPLFDRVQEVFKGYSKKPFRYACKPFAFRGLIKCADCGCTITAERTKNKYNYYSCTNGKKAHAKRLYINEETLLKPIYSVLRKIQLTDGQISRLMTNLKQNEEAKNTFFEGSMKTLRADYDKYEKRKSNLLDRLADEEITKEDYDKKLIEYDTKQTLISSEMATHQRADKEYYTTIAIILSLAKRAYAIFKSSEPMEKRAFLNFLLQNSKLRGKNLTFELKKPFNGALVAHSRNNLLRGLDSNQGFHVQSVA